jgi:hypothetical protein
VKRPPWEAADIIGRSGRRFVDRYRDSLTWPQVKVLRAIERCRTAALGGHRDQCDRCGHQTTFFNSCRNRHCPKCQSNAREKWLFARQQELLPAGYYHLVFSVPHALVRLMWQNKRVLFQLLFEASAATLLEVAAAGSLSVGSLTLVRHLQIEHGMPDAPAHQGLLAASHRSVELRMRNQQRGRA